MDTPLDDYKLLIDRIVEQRLDVGAQRILKQREWPDTPENRDVNSLITTLSDPQRAVLAQLLQHARDGGVHDVLACLNEQIATDGLRLTKNGRELPTEPFGTKLHYDWACRKEGDDWPPKSDNA